MTVWLRGDHLVRHRGPLARRPDEPLLLIEAESFARKLPYHPHKLTLVFAAMRQFRDVMREAGRPVHYRQVATFEDGLAAHFDEHPDDHLVTTAPQADGARERIESLVADAGGTVEFAPDERFLCSPEQFDAWAGEGRYRHEDFYRFMRRETGYLMAGGSPVGGEWNYDDQNRETPPEDWAPADPPSFEYDQTVHETAAWVEETFAGGYDDPPTAATGPTPSRSAGR